MTTAASDRDRLRESRFLQGAPESALHHLGKIVQTRIYEADELLFDEGTSRDFMAIIAHGAVEPLNRAYRAAGVELPPTLMASQIEDRADLERALVICPPSAAASPWLRRFGDAQTAFASGWMQLRGARLVVPTTTG